MAKHFELLSSLSISTRTLNLLSMFLAQSSCKQRDGIRGESRGRAHSGEALPGTKLDPSRPDAASGDDLANGRGGGVDAAGIAWSNDYLLRRESLAKELSGSKFLDAQRALVIDALDNLESFEALGLLLDGLAQLGEGDLRKEILSGPIREIFHGDEAAAARDWALSYARDRETREVLMRFAGEEFRGPGFSAFFERVGSEGCHNSQASLLTGYCVTLGKEDPEAALRTYQDLGYPERIDNSGLAAVVAAFPERTDFLHFVVKEIGEDAKGLAKQTRASLLANWAGHRPAEAAQYVMSNATTVYPEQMGVVMGVWASSAPGDAGDWLSKFRPGAHKDQGIVALARYWTKVEPPRAFALSTQTDDVGLRVAVATEVFLEWEKTDRESAVKAWMEAFPGSGESGE